MSASGKPETVAAPRLYVRAYDDFARTVERALPAVSAVVGQFVRRVGRECPDAVAGAPENSQMNEVSLAILGAVEGAMTGPEKPAMIKFIRTTRRLRWNDRKLAGLVGRYNRSLRAEIALAVPDLCADLKEWAASSFHVLPAGILKVNRQSTGRPDGALSLLARYVGANGKAVLRQARQAVWKIERAELKMGLDAWADILRIVGLQNGDRE
jgi:hypothetical protein